MQTHEDAYTMTNNILVCTVGGSHQPIVSAIRETGPDYVVFVCTDTDPASGQPGSRLQVEGAGNVIKARFQDSAPSLPNIPAQCTLPKDRYEVITVLADVLDDVVEGIQPVLAGLRGRFPEARLLADYTGGTKTMTAGLVMAALERDDVQLRLVTGVRNDLVRVRDGSEQSVEATAQGVRVRRAMAPYLAAWRRYGYAEAAEGFDRIALPDDERLRRTVITGRELSRAFNAWDRFDHQKANAILDGHRDRFDRCFPRQKAFLAVLATPDGDVSKTPARLLDLWFNAQRRAAQGRYDDAVARAYRLLEWAAQWLLHTHAGIDTSDIAEDRVPEGLLLSVNRDGKRQAGLFAAWELVAAHVSGLPADFAARERDRLREHLTARNFSILAHGYTPISAVAWQGFRDWIEDAFMPVLRDSFARIGVRLEPVQLPAELPLDGDAR